uniref:Large ribosomal subunit protein eL34 n=1 Tax=Biomphalaria glabrata TaxID=6526 RepID=A0A2C9K3J7_BIOGL
MSISDVQQLPKACRHRGLAHTLQLDSVQDLQKKLTTTKKKLAKTPICGDYKTRLGGVKAVRPHKLAAMSKRQKTVTRAYGGSRCHKAAKERIVRAFFIEEQKIVARVLKAQEASKKK